jgi:acetoin utilization deacetylase AcuC-like enzyme
VPLFFRHPASLDHDTGPGHPERPDRIRAIEAELEFRGMLGRAHPAEPGASREIGGAHPAEPGASREVAALGWEPRDAPRASEDQLLRVHPPEYVELVGEMSARGAAFDLDTPTSPGSLEAALRSAGGACALVESLLAGGERVGFSALRPPGHHAEFARAMGFCLFATVAVAARHALEALGAERVLVLDWDVHHGNGTNMIFHGSREVLFASIHQYPFWPGTGALGDVGSGEGEGYSLNLPVPAGTGEAAFLSLVEHVVAPVARQYRPDLILVSAGYDAHRDDPLGGLALDTASFGALALQVRVLGEELGAPVGAVLEGGYDLRALAGSVAATMQALGGEGDPPAGVARHPLADAAAGALGRYWDL